MNGYIIEGKVHAHMTLTDENGAFGGHLEPETHVFTFAIVTLGVMNEGVDFSRLDDKKLSVDSRAAATTWPLCKRPRIRVSDIQ